MLVDFSDPDAFDTLVAFDLHDRVAELERDAEVIEALHDIPLEAARVWHELSDDLDMGAFEREPAGHDEANVARAQDHDLASRKDAFDVHEMLRASCRIDAGRTGARDIEGTTRPLSAAHCKDHRACFDLDEAELGTHGRDDAVVADIDDRAFEQALDAALLCLIDIALRILGAGELLIERMETEPVMDALVEDAAEPVFALEDDDIFESRIIGRDGSSKAGRTAADDNTGTLHQRSPPSP